MVAYGEFLEHAGIVPGFSHVFRRVILLFKMLIGAKVTAH
jgi:hypothetical protein